MRWHGAHSGLNFTYFRPSTVSVLQFEGPAMLNLSMEYILCRNAHLAVVLDG